MSENEALEVQTSELAARAPKGGSLAAVHRIFTDRQPISSSCLSILPLHAVIELGSTEDDPLGAADDHPEGKLKS